jgi:hypothetical protein
MCGLGEERVILVANKRATSDTQSVATGQASRSLAWLQLLVVPLGIMAIRDRLSAWAFMWSLAFSIYAPLKWESWWRERAVTRPPAWCSAAYFLAWPGMDATAFPRRDSRVVSPRPQAWAAAVADHRQVNSPSQIGPILAIRKHLVTMNLFSFFSGSEPESSPRSTENR